METDLDDPEAVEEHMAKNIQKTEIAPSFSLCCVEAIYPPIYTFNIEIETCGACSSTPSIYPTGKYPIWNVSRGKWF